MQETQDMQICSLGGEDPLEEEMAAHSSILAWKIPWTEESGRLQGPCGHKGSDTTERLITHTHTHTHTHTLLENLMGSLGGLKIRTCTIIGTCLIL